MVSLLPSVRKPGSNSIHLFTSSIIVAPSNSSIAPIYLAPTSPDAKTVSTDTVNGGTQMSRTRQMGNCIRSRAIVLTIVNKLTVRMAFWTWLPPAAVLQQFFGIGFYSHFPSYVHINIYSVFCVVLYCRNLVSASQDGKLIVWDAYTTNKVLMSHCYISVNVCCGKVSSTGGCLLHLPVRLFLPCLVVGLPAVSHKK